MDLVEFIGALPTWAWFVLAIGLGGPLLSMVTAVGLFVIKRIVIIKERRKPPHVDTGDYRLGQGREVRPEEDDLRRGNNRVRP